MVYRKVQGPAAPAGGPDENRISYRVCEGEELAAEFSYHIEHRPQDEECRFWIDEIRMTEAYSSAATMEAVLQFIQYKCQAAGCPAMHVKLDQKNRFYLEQYLKFGFYLIDQEERESGPDEREAAREGRELPRGYVSCMSVLKYPLPDSKEEVFRSYILRSERKRAKRQPME